MGNREALLFELAEEVKGFMPSNEGLAPEFRKNIKKADLEETVVAVVGDSPLIAKDWTTPLSLLFIDGGHGSEPAHADYENWVPKLLTGGKLLIHDVFEDPNEGGRPPFEIFQRALNSGSFQEIDAVGSLRVLTNRLFFHFQGKIVFLGALIQSNNGHLTAS